MHNKQSGTPAAAKTALLEMLRGAEDMKRAIGGSVTDAIAGWLAPTYALAAQQRLAATEGEEHLKILRDFVQDWALLRHGDQTAGRLQIERERLQAAARDADLKWKRKTIVGLEALLVYVRERPELQTAFDALAAAVRHPFDPTEAGLGQSAAAAIPDPAESD